VEIFITIPYGLDSLFWNEWKVTWLSLRNLTTDLYESELKVCSLIPFGGGITFETIRLP